MVAFRIAKTRIVMATSFVSLVRVYVTIYLSHSHMSRVCQQHISITTSKSVR